MHARYAYIVYLSIVFNEIDSISLARSLAHSFA